MSWNYRILKQEHKAQNETEYAIVECYTSSDDKDSIGYTEPVIVSTFVNELEPDFIASLRWQLTEMLKALDRPVIEAKSNDV